jgi:methylaspartate ammonia-lyase
MSMHIADVVVATGLAGHFHLDFAALKAGARADGFVYQGPPRTPGFERIVQPARVLSLMLVLADGQVAFGDCVDVAFAGAAGRDPPFDPEAHLGVIETAIAPLLRGAAIDSFKPLAEQLDALEVGGRPLHTALRYGLTQALLHAAALARHETPAEVIARDYGTQLAETSTPIQASCELEDHKQLDRMILKRVALLPHAYFTDVQRQLGPDGGKLRAYARSVAARVAEIGDAGYRPGLLFDLSGSLGDLLANDVEAVAAFLASLGRDLAPFEVLIESPIVARTQSEQIALIRRLCTSLRGQGSRVRIVVDEWCNTLDDVRVFATAGAGDVAHIKMPDLGGINNSIAAVLACRAHGMGACLGGSANETDQSARLSAHVALATRPDFMLAKPGMGGDEALMIQANEMARTLALVRHRAVKTGPRERSGGER